MPYGTIVADKITTSDGYTVGGSGSHHLKNRIINGGMIMNQRGWSGNVSTDGTYTLDRWLLRTDLTNKLSITQSSSAPTGFSNSLLVTTTTAVASPNYYMLAQYVEGFNTADLAWGTSNAKTVTLSFWVYSSLTGTFGGSITNSAESYSYPFSYTISAANTWEQKTITITGPTAGTWIGATNGKGLNLYFGLGLSSGLSGPAGTWASSGYYSATGATSVVSTLGATFYITGVQLEAGSTATSYDYRHYSVELQMCQRYYYRITPQTSSYNVFGTGYSYNTTNVRVYVPFPVTMRTTPSTFDFSSAANYLLENNSGLTRSASSIADSTNSGNNGALLTCGVSATTAGLVWMCLANGTTSAYMGFGAEL